MQDQSLGRSREGGSGERSAGLGLDLAAARVGGGTSRIRELLAGVAELAPQLRCLVAMSVSAGQAAPSLPENWKVVGPPRMGCSVPERLLWEHLRLPYILGRAGLDWILSPFNVLPLGPAPGRRPRTALIVSNIGPFHPGLVDRATGYESVRLRLLRELTKASIARADKIFLLSRQAQDLLWPVLRHKHCVFLPMTPPSPKVLEEAELYSAPSALKGAPYFLAVGDLMQHKGIEDVILALGTIVQSDHEPILAVAGNPIEPRYASRLRDLAGRVAPGRVQFFQGLQQEQTIGLMMGSIATVFCSQVENPGRVPIEAMTVGAPLLAASTANARWSIGDAALYYEPGKAAELAELMRLVYRDDSIRRQLASRGPARLRGLDWLSATRLILETLGLL